MRIGEVAREAGVAVGTVRYYERKGLLTPPPRTEAGYRSYAAEAVTTLRLVRWAQSLGFTLREIAALLQPGDHGRSGQRFRARIGEKVAEIDARLAALTLLRQELADVGACRCRGRCPVIARVLAETAPASGSRKPLPGTRRRSDVDEPVDDGGSRGKRRRD